VARSCKIKAEVVRQDEREGGLRAILNFGHTLGHAVEKVSGYGRFLHGEAISIGMHFAGRLSVAEGGFSQDECDRLTALLDRLELPLKVSDLSWDALRQAVGVDKKTRGGIPKFVLADALGSVQFGCEVPENVVEEVWHVCCQ